MTTLITSLPAGAQPIAVIALLVMPWVLLILAGSYFLL